jgi:hypothetical protein
VQSLIGQFALQHAGAGLFSVPLLAGHAASSQLWGVGQADNCLGVRHGEPGKQFVQDCSGSGIACCSFAHFSEVDSQKWIRILSMPNASPKSFLQSAASRMVSSSGNNLMSTAKQDVEHLLNKLPDNSSVEDIQYHLYVLDKVRRGLEDARTNGTISQEEVETRLSKWLTE